MYNCIFGSASSIFPPRDSVDNMFQEFSEPSIVHWFKQKRIYMNMYIMNTKYMTLQTKHDSRFCGIGYMQYIAPETTSLVLCSLQSKHIYLKLNYRHQDKLILWCQLAKNLQWKLGWLFYPEILAIHGDSNKPLPKEQPGILLVPWFYSGAWYNMMEGWIFVLLLQ